ncbi:hypothetical protein [Microbispora bryophytorum]|uniref:hypothetical protein n=1 Tax=Microbispora bryophytorum TaxID=1460882 RepID=UPI0034116F96
MSAHRDDGGDRRWTHTFVSRCRAGDGFEEWPGEAGRAMACFPGGDRGRVRAVRHDATGPW